MMLGVSAKRGSWARSGRPTTSQASGQYFAAWRQMSETKRPSPVRKFPASGLLGAEAPAGAHGVPNWSDSAMAAPIAQMPVPRSDTSTTVASPVTARW